jgi:hypothetical protein
MCGTGLWLRGARVYLVAVARMISVKVKNMG